MSTQVLPTQLLSGNEARELEPDLSPDIASALLSPETGIIDSHSYMESLERDIMESENGDIAYSTAVVRVDPYDRSKLANGVPDLYAKEAGWIVQLITRNANGTTQEEEEGDARVLMGGRKRATSAMIASMNNKSFRSDMTGRRSEPTTRSISS